MVMRSYHKVSLEIEPRFIKRDHYVPGALIVIETEDESLIKDLVKAIHSIELARKTSGNSDSNPRS